jgi:hypothetical protein
MCDVRNGWQEDVMHGPLLAPCGVSLHCCGKTSVRMFLRSQALSIFASTMALTGSSHSPSASSIKSICVRHPARPAFPQRDDSTAGEDAAAADEDADPNADVGHRRVRRRPDPKSAATAAAGRDVGEAAGEREAARGPVRISRQRWVYLQNHVLACLKQAEAGEMDEQAAEINVSAQKFIGLSQHDIIKWHIKTEIEKYVTMSACLVSVLH